MKRKYVIGLDGSGIDEMLRGIEEYKRWLMKKTDQLAQMAANTGYEFAYTVLSNHVYSGETLSSLTVEKRGEAQYVVKAESEAILFLEFGSGLRGYGHPEPQGFGPGTYPGKGHWSDPGGWWFETDDPNLIVYTSQKTGKSYGHSYGNPPYMPMYGAVKELDLRFDDMVREVFSD